MKKILFPVIMAGVLVSACTERRNSEVSTQLFVTDSLHWADTLRQSANVAAVSIDVAYPMGESTDFVDSVRIWIAEQFGYDKASIGGESELLEDGRALMATAGGMFLKTAQDDLGEFAQDEIAGFEYVREITVAPIFVSDSIVTFSYSEYTYTGGAHGSSVKLGQSFCVNTGKRVTAADMFPQNTREGLMELIRQSLQKQYFAVEANGDITLEEALLISPDMLPLPQCPPLLLDSGVMFIYQQYEIACYAAGIPTCVVPYDVLGKLMPTVQ